MLKAKLPLIILLVLLIISGIITFQFYSDKQNLINENEDLRKERASLNEKNNALRSKYRDLNKMYTNDKKKLNDVQRKLSKISREKEELNSKYDVVYKEREQLVLQLRKLSQAKQAPAAKEKGTEALAASDAYWSDVVRKKAESEAKLGIIQRQLLDTKTEISRLQKGNKELSLKIDELTKVKDRLEKDLSFKEKTMVIMSKDLVNEREARTNLANEVGKLRDDSMGLKRELIVANRDKIKLQDMLKDMIKKKDDLEKTVGEVENVLKEKRMMFSELENQLAKAVGRKMKTGKDSAFVELPPIVVKSDTSGKSLKGEILAVNKNDNFIIIDLGEDAGVRPGAKFNIVRFGETIGNVEVIETRKEISAADIKEVNSGYTIHEGDTVFVR